MPSFVRSGAPIRANSQTASTQNKSSITALADGGFVVIWQTMDNSADGSWWAIKSQRYNAQGVAVGAETLVNNLGAGDQTAARSASLANGGYIVTWETSDTSQDGSGTAIKARLFDSTGTAVGGEFRVNSQTAQDQKDPTVSGLTDGGFVVAWYTTDSSQDGAGWAIKAQRYDFAGVAVGAEFLVNTTAFGSQWKTDIAGLTNGGFIVTWQTGNDANAQVYGQLYGADGVKMGGQFVANGSITYDTLGKVAALPGGGFVVTWMTYDSDSLGIRAQIFNASGAKVGSDFAVNSVTEGTQWDPDIAALADGTFLITWDSKGFGIKGQAFTATGQRIGGEFLVANGGSANGTGVAVAGLAGGNFAVSFTNNAGTSSGDDIELQMLQYNSTPNAPPQLGAETLSLSKQENQTSVTQLFATDSDGPYAITYSIVGGTDAARFTLNAVTGTLSFVSSPNYEAPTDSDKNNVYQVVVRASDGEHHDQQTISVTVTNTNEALAITSNGAGASAALSVAENKVDVTKVTAVDPEGAPITYSISGGVDATRFLIDSSTGALTFLTAPDYEQPGDSDGNNIYLVTVRASDGTWTDTQALTITVTNANDRPVIVSNGGGASASIGLDEGQTAVTTVAATDGDGPNPVTYSITGGADAALFAIDSATGALSFVAAPDHEAPAHGSNNVYSVTVTASDGALSDSQTLQVSVNNVNEGVTITSGATQTVAENSTAVTTVTAEDLDGDTVSFAISGGADSGLFAVDSATGELRFLAAPNFESPGDFDGDNVYEVEVSASDGTLSGSKSISVTVTDQNEAIAFVSGGGGDQAAVTIDENSGDVFGLAAVDPDGTVPQYGIAGGADAALFELDPVTKALRFKALPDFEAPRDSNGDNVYEVIVGATDGQSSDYQSVSVTVANVYEGVSFAAPSSAFSVDEGTAPIGAVSARGEAGAAIVYAIAGGADASLFNIDPATGALGWVAAPDHEEPADSGGDNVYDLIVSASDGTASASQTVSVTVGDIFEPVEIVSYGGAESVSLTKTEGYWMIGAIVHADDEEGFGTFDTVVYSITGGADAALFTVDPNSGALNFTNDGWPDFESPADSDGDNVYEVVVTAATSVSSDTQAFSITIADMEEGLFITSNGGVSSASVAVAEGGIAVTVVEADDPDGGTISYAIAGGADAARFTIDSSTGALAFVAAPNFESAADSGADNVYEVVVSASDGSVTETQSLSVTVGNVDEPVEILSYGGAASVALAVIEDEFAVGIVQARDEDESTVTYAITGGVDADSFEIDALTGALSFKQPNAGDFEDPTDQDSDNVHEVVVTASSSTSSATQAFMISITNRNEAPAFSYESSLTVDEGVQAITTLIGYDRDGDTPTLAIVGGADAALFELDPVTNLLTFVQARDFEAPLSVAGTNVYIVEIEASDGELSTRQSLQVTVRNVNEGVAITSGGGSETLAVTAAENGMAATTLAASDVDGDVLTWSIAGGADSSRFTIDARTGALRFVQAPNFEAPADVGADNVYDVVVSVTDGAFTDSQAVAVTVANVTETVVITSSGGGESASVAVAENGTAVATVAASAPGGGSITYAISGGADSARFTIDAATGTLAFAAAPNFEAPADAGADNVYDVVVSATNGDTVDTQALAVTVGNVNEPMAITSNGGGANAAVTVSENNKAVTTVVAADVDGDPIEYLLIGGADFASFTINSTTGELAFKVAPDFEAPADSGADNVYEVIVWASDGHYTDYQTIAVTVANVVEPVVITSSGGGAGGSVAVAENGTVVATVTATNRDGGTLTYAIAGGADAARFTIDARTGALAFVAAPNFEAPADAGANNVYDVVVSASNGSSSDTQALAVTVGNVNEGVTITSNGGGSSASLTRGENGTAVTVVAASDADGGAVTYAIAGGADASRFTIDAATGALAFIAAPNFEAPADSGGNNVYDVVVSASDGSFVDTQAIAVTVGNVAEAPVITSSGGGAGGALSVAENSLVVSTVAAADPDGTAPTYSIVGGADAARFTINAQTGVLQFVAAPDWELPADSNGDNVYSLVVRASDGQLVDDQVLNVTVTNTRDGNNVTGTSGSDSISSSSLNLALRTSNEEDLVFGRDGHDTISGMAGDDELYGEGGNDVLIGGAGADKLLGGLGKDTFTYNAQSESTGASSDLIMDFSRSQGDKISLSGIDANSLAINNQAFTFIGTSAFSNVAGQLRYETTGGMTTVFGDVNGDGVADLQIQLSGSIALISSDFIL
jgi:hypothetical protein